MEHEAGVEPACFGFKAQRGCRQPTGPVTGAPRSNCTIHLSSVTTIRRSSDKSLTFLIAAPSCVLPMRVAVWIASRSAMPVRGGTSTQLSLKANTRTDSQTPRATIATPAAASARVMSDLRESRADMEPELSTSTIVVPVNFGSSASAACIAVSSWGSNCFACRAAAM
jgi:hypothetical protein